MQFDLNGLKPAICCFVENVSHKQSHEMSKLRPAEERKGGLSLRDGSVAPC